MLERPLEHRSEQRVVADDDRPMALPRLDLVGDAKHGLEIDQRIDRVGRRFNEDDRDAAAAAGLVGGGADGGFVDTVVEADGGDAEPGKRPCQQRLSAAVKGLRMQDRVARPDEGKERGGNRRHARREQDTCLRALVDGEAILDDLAIGVVEARIDEAGLAAARRLPASGDIVEEIAPVFRGPECESRCQENRRLHRSFRKLRIEPVAEHQRFRMQPMVADMRLVRAWRCHGGFLR